MARKPEVQNQTPGSTAWPLDAKGPFLSTTLGRWIGRVAIVAATLIAYSPLRSADFIWDDPDYIIDNMTLRNLRGLWNMWVHPLSLPQYYPLVHTTFWIEFHTWKFLGLPGGGLWPVGYHIDNVLLHALSALVLWEILDALSIPGGLLAATLFALHPVHVESVAWVTERKNVLSALLYLLSLRCFLRQGVADFKFDGRWYAASMLLFAGALLSKSVTCTLPVAILILAWWKTGRIDCKRLLAVTPMLVLGLAMGMVTAVLERTHVNAVGHDWLFSKGDRLVIAGRAIWFYPWKLLWPTNLVFVYRKWTIDRHAWKQLLAPAMVALVTVTLAALVFVEMLRARPSRPWRGALAAWMFYGVTIFPALGFANIYPMRYTFVADHYVYLASLGLFVPLAAVLWKLPRVWLASVSGVLVVTLMALTMSRSRVFLGPIPLWEDVIAKNEWSWMAHENLGHAYNARWQGDAKGSPEQAADEQKAQEQYLIADRLTPAWVSDVHWGLAGFYFRQNRFDEAQGELQEVLDLDPNNERVWSLLGDVQSAKGLFDEAARTYRKASDIDPGSSGPHTRLGTLYEMKLLDDSDAEHEYRTALALNPNDLLAHYNLGNILLKQKKFTDSIAQFQAVLALDSNHPEALYNEAVAYAYLHDNASAAACANDVLKLNPQFDPARELLRRLGMPETP